MGLRNGSLTQVNRNQLREFLAGAHVAPEVFGLRPDYRVVLVAVSGINPDLGAETVDQLVAQAEAHARALSDAGPLTEVPHIASWREAYRSFGAKPSDYKNSAEALTRRAVKGLPRINPLTDLYNALSVLYSVPIGGEDLATYVGSPRLIRATGTEPFDTVADGQSVIDHPEPGEVVWVDDAGVTCRRWNWRQCQRTALTEHTSTALFIADALGAISNDALAALETDLVGAVRQMGNVVVETALICG